MSSQQVNRPHGQDEDKQARRWGGIGIPAVAAAKSVKPAQSKPGSRDATLQRLIDSVSDK